MKKTMDATVIRCSNVQSDRIGEVMSKAFFNEPNFTYMLPNSKARGPALRWFFGTFTAKISFQYGEVYGTTSMSGAAMWMRPGKAVTFKGALKAGMLAFPFKFGWSAFRRAMALNGYLEKIRKQSVPEPHWYLMAVGVDPGDQGTGIGSTLLYPVLTYADEKRQLCYLETFHERNLPFYEKNGFEVLEKYQIPKGGPVFWTMIRKPHQ